MLEPIIIGATTIGGKVASDVIKRLAKLEFGYALAGMILGGVIALAGIAMIFTGRPGPST